jgi:rhamnosyltransferase
MNYFSYAIFIPTLNAQTYLPCLLPLLDLNNSFFVDSSSSDETYKILLDGTWKVISIDRKNFNHGGTRNLCLELCDRDFVIFMTQDALPKDHTLFSELLKPFADPSVAATYAKQLPRHGAGTLEQLDRTFKYPDYPIIQSKETLEFLGARTYFLSNSCAAYRMSVFRELGGFPDTEIMAEDATYAYKLINNGYKIVYTPSAEVYHSHDYSLIQNFKRYFDTGVYRSTSELAKSDISKKDVGQGSQYVRYCIREIISRKEYLLLINLLANTIFSFLGYVLGKNYVIIPNPLRKLLSMHSYYWSSPHFKNKL